MEPPLRFVLGSLVILFNLLDNATTFLCLSAPVEGFQVVEANPFARWLFEAIGLTEGLVVEMLITCAAVGFLVFTKRLPPRVQLTLLLILVVLPAWAVVNNLGVMKTVGIAL